jgi:hypothetical protein
MSRDLKQSDECEDRLRIKVDAHVREKKYVSLV